MFKLGWGHRTKLYDVLEAEGGHRTFQLRLFGQMFKLGGDTAHDAKMF